MPRDNPEGDPCYVHYNDFDPDQFCSTPGCYRDCSPSYSKCCRLCGIDENGNNVHYPYGRLPSGPQCWQHELLCLPVHGMLYPNGVRQEALPHQIRLWPPPPVDEVAISDPGFVDNNNRQLGMHLQQRFPDQDFGDDHDVPPVTEVAIPDLDFVDNDDDNDDTADIINNLDWLCSTTV